MSQFPYKELSCFFFFGFVLRILRHWRANASALTCGKKASRVVCRRTAGGVGNDYPVTVKTAGKHPLSWLFSRSRARERSVKAVPVNPLIRDNRRCCLSCLHRLTRIVGAKMKRTEHLYTSRAVASYGGIEYHCKYTALPCTATHPLCLVRDDTTPI